MKPGTIPMPESVEAPDWRSAASMFNIQLSFFRQSYSFIPRTMIPYLGRPENCETRLLQYLCTSRWRPLTGGLRPPCLTYNSLSSDNPRAPYQLQHYDTCRARKIVKPDYYKTVPMPESVEVPDWRSAASLRMLNMCRAVFSAISPPNTFSSAPREED